MIATARHIALFGALLAAAAGAWFALGTTLSPLWNNHVPMGGSPASPHRRTRGSWKQLGFFSALGVVIVFIAAAAFGRILSVPSGIRTVEPVTQTVPAETVPAETAPAETAPAETIPAETVPGETVPGEAVPAREVATSGLPMRKVVARDVPADAAPAQDTSTEDTRTIG